MSAPVTLTQTPRADGPSPNQRARATTDTSDSKVASFATVIEKGLKHDDKLEPQTQTADSLDSEPTNGSEDRLKPETEEEKKTLADTNTTPIPIDLSPDAFIKHTAPTPADQSIEDGGGDNNAAGIEAKRHGLAKEPISGNASAVDVDLEGATELEPKKGVRDAIRSGVGEKTSFRESMIVSPRETEHSPLPANSEQRADAETVAAVGRSLQSLSASASSVTAPTPMLAAGSGRELSDGLDNQIRWMLDRQSPVAELKLNPPNLGSMEVRITLDKEATNIQFLVHNVAAKDAVEDALPRLRILLNDVGVNLQNVGVEEHTGGQHQHNAHSGYTTGHDDAYTEGEGHFGEETSGGVVGLSANAGDRIIDAYA